MYNLHALHGLYWGYDCLLALGLPTLRALTAMGCAASAPAVVEPTPPATPGGGLSRKVKDDPDSLEALAHETFCEQS